MRRFYKLCKVFCLICVTMILFTTIGASSWYFFREINASQEATQIGDNIRPNQYFGDGEDSQITDTKYYDVYFLAQNVQDIKNEFLVEDGTIMENNVEVINYKMNNPNNALYYKNLDFPNAQEPEYEKDGGDLRYGYWDISKGATSPYYWKWADVNIVTASMLSTMKNPSCQMTDINNYSLEFNSWIINPYNIYVKPDDPNWTSLVNKDGKNHIRVYGSYPFQNFTAAYFNNLLQIYDEHAIYINGRKSIFFYPIYSTGKGYYAYNVGQEGSDYLRDSIAIKSKEAGTESFFVYSPQYTKSMHEKEMLDVGEEKNATDLTRYHAYRYTEYIVEEEDLTSTYYIDNDIDYFKGSWSGNKKEFTINGETLKINDRVGRYNFYLFVKERYHMQSMSIFDNDISEEIKSSAAFTNDEKQKLTEIVETANIHIYKTFDIDIHQNIKSESTGMFRQNLHWDARDYYLIVEKKYEPRLIAGTTHDFNWLNPQSKQLSFIKNGMEGEDLDSYILRDVSFNTEEGNFGYIHYEVKNTAHATAENNRKVMIPDYYFAIKPSRDNDITYTQHIGRSDIAKYQMPTYKYYNYNNEIITEYYSGKEELISFMDAVVDNQSWTIAKDADVYKDIDRVKLTTQNDPTTFYSLREYITKGMAGEKEFLDYKTFIESMKLIRPKETGTYNIFMHIIYDETTQLPFVLDVLAYRKHNIFVNIYDPEDFGGKKLDFDGTYLLNADIDNFSFRCNSFYYLKTDLMYENDGTTYKAFIKSSDSKISLKTNDQNGNYDIFSIIKYYDEQGKCLQDIVSGRYITLQNCQNNPFIISKNYILQVVNKPNS